MSRAPMLARSFSKKKEREDSINQSSIIAVACVYFYILLAAHQQQLNSANGTLRLTTTLPFFPYTKHFIME